MRLQINVYEDNSEKINYNVDHIPIYLRESRISYFDNYRTLGHWHDEIEIIIITRGEMIYCVNGRNIHMREGDGVLVNSGQLHNEFSINHSDCRYICFLFSPMLLCTNEYIERKFISPITKNANFEFIMLEQDINWKKELRESTIRAFKSYTKGEADYILKIQSEMFTIWSLLYENIPMKAVGDSSKNQLYSIKEMVRYIHKHYKEKISLQNIADSGHMCKSSCCGVFKSQMHQSPIEYLNYYRVLKSAKLLKNTEHTITEIAYRVGFSGASYYAECFRLQYGISPRDYRKAETT